MAAADSAQRVLAGEVRPGFQSPAELFGAAFAESIVDAQIRDVQLVNRAPLGNWILSAISLADFRETSACSA